MTERIFAWGLPENGASDLVTVAKRAVDVPEMIAALRRGEATVSKLRKVCPVISAGNQKEWLDLVRECSTRVVEKAVAMAKPETGRREAAVYRAGDRIEIKFSAGEEFLEGLTYAQDLVSQRTHGAASIEQTLAELIKFYLDKNDPVARARRAAERAARRAAGDHASCANADVSIPPPTAPNRNSPPKRRALKRQIFHRVTLRDAHRCTYVVDDGRRCGQRRWLDLHHVIPWERGGADAEDNLVTLCRAHHRMRHAGDGRDIGALRG